jgi:hypothetical protein
VGHREAARVQTEKEYPDLAAALLQVKRGRRLLLPREDAFDEEPAREPSEKAPSEKTGATPETSTVHGGINTAPSHEHDYRQPPRHEPRNSERDERADDRAHQGVHRTSTAHAARYGVASHPLPPTMSRSRRRMRSGVAVVHLRFANSSRMQSTSCSLP